MKTTTQLLFTLATAAAIASFAGCEVDESAPSHPRTAANILTPDSKANDDAFNRVNEKPQREMPTSGAEFPGHSQANAPTVITADAASTAPATNASETTVPAATAPASTAAAAPCPCMIDKPAPLNGTNAKLPETRYPDNNWYPGPLPHLLEKPGAVMTGSTPVPGTGWVIEHSWGQVLPLQDYPHRNWHDTQATYVPAEVKHNPVYFFNLQNRVDVPQNDATQLGNHFSNIIEVPWFYAQTVALPVLMVLQCPFAHVTTQRLGGDPVYFGHLPATGAIVPSMTPGIIRWEYPFLVPTKDGQPPPYQPITPTPGISLPPEPSATTQPEVPAAPSNVTPGLN